MKLAAIDSETTGLDLAHGCKPFFVSACTEDGDITTWEWPVDPYTREPIIPKNEIVEVSDYLASYNPIFHNATFDLKALATIGVKGIYKAARRARDTTMAAHCFNSQQSLKLKDLCLKYLDILDDDEEELMRVIKKLRNSAKTLEWKVMDASVFPHRKRAPRGGWAPADMWIPKAYADHVLKESDEPKDQEKYKHYSTVLSTYAIRDAERTMALYLMFRDGLKHEGLWNHFVEQCGLIKVTHSIERKGIHIHRDSIPPTIQKYALIKHKYSQQAKKISDKVSSAPEKLNLRSPLQMSKFLFDDLELPVVIRTKPGNKRCSFCKDFLLNEETSKLTCIECNSKPSTNKEALLKLRDQVAEGSREHDFLTGVLVDRKIGKAIDYAQSYYDIAVGKKLYPNLNTNGTATTRCSMSNPNGQNVGNPEEDSSGIATELRDAGIDLRALFGPRKGRRWYALDYAQLQLRIFAFVSQEVALIKAFEDGWDAHSYMAHRIFKLPDGTQPSKQQRRIAKNVNFGFIFGARPAKIEATANKPGLWDDVTGMFPNAHKFILSTSKFIRKNGYITTTSGYRLYIPRHADGRRKDYAGVNYIVQGDEGIIVKRAMIACHKLINSNEYKKKHDAFITLQVHDELVFDVNRQDAEVSLIPEIAKCMEDAGKSLGFITPVDVDRIDKHWSKGVKLSL